jgi:hypothetical protein
MADMVATNNATNRAPELEWSFLTGLREAGLTDEQIQSLTEAPKELRVWEHIMDAVIDQSARSKK